MCGWYLDPLDFQQFIESDVVCKYYNGRINVTQDVVSIDEK